MVKYWDPILYVAWKLSKQTITTLPSLLSNCLYDSNLIKHLKGQMLSSFLFASAISHFEWQGQGAPIVILLLFLQFVKWKYWLIRY